MIINLLKFLSVTPHHLDIQISHTFTPNYSQFSLFQQRDQLYTRTVCHSYTIHWRLRMYVSLKIFQTSFSVLSAEYIFIEFVNYWSNRDQLLRAGSRKQPFCEFQFNKYYCKLSYTYLCTSPLTTNFYPSKINLFTKCSGSSKSKVAHFQRIVYLILLISVVWPINDRFNVLFTVFT